MRDFTNMREKIAAYRESHGLTDEAAKKYGLVFGVDRISIPVRDKDGSIAVWKHRMFDGPAKYRYDTGGSMQLFNRDRITEDTKEVWIVEGEFDAIALGEYWDLKSGTVVVTSTGGAGTWADEWTDDLVGKKVFILLDNDKPGRDGALRIWEKVSMKVKEVEIMHITTSQKDVCEVLAGLDDGEFFDNRIETVIPWWITMMDTAGLEPGRARNNALLDMAHNVRDMTVSISDAPSKKKLAYLMQFVEFVISKQTPIKRTVRMPEMANGEITGDIPLARLREVPIDTFISFDGARKAKCIFHDDSHPSMQYNPPGKGRFPNTVKCFSCGKFCGVVDVVMKLNNTDFRGAVEILKRHV